VLDQGGWVVARIGTDEARVTTTVTLGRALGSRDRLWLSAAPCATGQLNKVPQEGFVSALKRLLGLGCSGIRFQIRSRAGQAVRHCTKKTDLRRTRYA
jgi:hypothetical protein